MNHMLSTFEYNQQLSWQGKMHEILQDKLLALRPLFLVLNRLVDADHSRRSPSAHYLPTLIAIN
jgi:hypothetical protein